MLGREEANILKPHFLLAGSKVIALMLFFMGVKGGDGRELSLFNMVDLLDIIFTDPIVFGTCFDGDEAFPHLHCCFKLL